MQSRFQEAVQLAESAFAEELTSLVAHLAERLSGKKMVDRKFSAIQRWRTYARSLIGSGN